MGTGCPGMGDADGGVGCAGVLAARAKPSSASRGAWCAVGVQGVDELPSWALPSFPGEQRAGRA